jgi:hypothetical protein
VSQVGLETRLDGAGRLLAAARRPARRAAASGALAHIDDGANRRLSATWPSEQPKVVLNWTLLEPPRPRQGPSALTGAIQRAFRPRRTTGGWLANTVRGLWRRLDDALATLLNVG